MSDSKVLTVQRTVFDLDSFDDVLLKKQITFTPAGDMKAALEVVGGDHSKLVAIINRGLEAEIRDTAYASPDGWQATDDEGTITGAFSGTPADTKGVNALRLTLAKTVFGYSKDGTPESRKAAKDAAMEMIKNTAAIKEGLKKSAALGPESE